MENSETVDGKTLSIPVNRETCTLFYFAKVLNIDLPYLYFMYKKYGNDIFYFFYMMMGKKISVPKEDRFLLLFRNADELYHKITADPDFEITRIKDLEIYAQLKDSLDEEDKEFRM